MGSDLMILVVGEHRLEARLQRGKMVLWSGQIEYQDQHDLSEAIAGLVSEPSLVNPGKRMLVELQRPVVQLRTLNDIPPVRPRHLRALVEQQGQRYFRKNGSPLVVDAMREAGRRAGVKAAATDESLVAAIAAGAKAGGFRLEDVRPAEWPGLRLSLLLKEDRERRQRLAQLSLRRLGIGVILLWLGAIAVGVGSHVTQRRAVARELAALSQPVAAFREARRQQLLTRETIAVLDQEEAGRSRLVAMLSAIAAAMPDSSFLSSVSMEADGTGRIAGYAKRGSEVLARLDAAQAVVAPDLENQRSRQQIGGREMESFSIRFGTQDTSAESP